MTSTKRISNTQLWLTLVFVTALCISNIIAGKQMQLPFGITVPSGVIVFPITYILSDVFSEVYGYKYSRQTCYMGFAMNLMMVMFFNLMMALPYPEWWKDQVAFETVFMSTPRFVFAGFIAYIAGDYVNDRVFQVMKNKHDAQNTGMKFAPRAFLSSCAGEVFDSGLFIFIAFVGEMPVSRLLIMFSCQWVFKVAYEAAVLPLTSIITKVVKAREHNESGE